MTIENKDGPLVTRGVESPIGSTTPLNNAAGSIAYISGVNENPDAGPNVFFAGNLFKDMRYRARESGGGLAVGGYANQAVGLVDHHMQTLDFVPSLISTTNLAALQAPASGVAMTLVASTALGITVTTAAVAVLPTGNVVPTAMRRIDADPTWSSVSYASSAIMAWSRNAAGRAVSLTSTANLSAINFTIRGYDLYGNALTHTMAGPNNGTVTSTKCFKWVASITPSGSSGSQLSAGTGDVYEFPMRADKFGHVEIIWNDARITANTGFVAAVTTSPATATTGSVRGTYLVPTASDGTKSLQVYQNIPMANLLTVVGVFGVTPV